MNQEKNPVGSGKYLQSVTEEEEVDVETLGLSLIDIGDVSPPNQNTTNNEITQTSTSRSKQTRPSYYAGYVPKTPKSSKGTTTLAAVASSPIKNPGIHSTPQTTSSTITDTKASVETIKTPSSSTPPMETKDPVEIQEGPTRDKMSNNDLPNYSRQSSLISFSGDSNDMSSSALAIHSDMYLSPEGMGNEFMYSFSKHIFVHL